MSKLRDSYGRISGSRRIIIRTATDDGIIGGNEDANVNGLITPVDFYIQPVINETFEITHLSVEISDSGNPGISDYGSVAGPLANGIELFIELDGNRVPLGVPYKSNKQIMSLGATHEQLTFSGSTKVTIYHFDFLKYSNSGVIIHGKHLEKLGMSVNDDLSALISHTISFKGSGYRDV